tara:strand:- start:13775 stop:14065 length:291 start_codon:yes stop_codon:yes gene_type:complete
MKRKFVTMIEGRYINPENYVEVELDELGIPENYIVSCISPYEVCAVYNGYKVGREDKKLFDNGKKFLSDKPMELNEAIKEMRMRIFADTERARSED